MVDRVSGGSGPDAADIVGSPQASTPAPPSPSGCGQRFGVAVPSLVTAYLGLGANLGQPEQTLAAAVKAIRDWPDVEVCGVSRLYHSAPMGPQNQPDYCNAVLEIQTAQPAAGLLTLGQQTESAFGRVRREHWGARSLDIDVLLYGDAQIQTPSLRVPHPGLAERAFVVFPLMDLAPGLRLPGGQRLAAVAEQLQAEPLRRVQDWAP